MSLYRSASGREVTHASSSSLDVFRQCRRKFKLSRIDGWKQKSRKASLEIGKCLESALQFFYDNGLKPGDFVDEWKRLWLKFQGVELTYTDQETDWKTIYTVGTEWARLFEVTYPTLPIQNPKWQLQFLKKIWPGDATYGDLEFMAYIDLLSTMSDGSRRIIDIKTAKSPLSVTPGMMSLDGQLRKYAWVSGIRDVGFLNFVKTANPDEFRKGTNVTLLEDSRDWKSGQQLVVAKFTSPKEAVEASEGVKASPAVPWSMLVGTEETVQKMDDEQEACKGKGSTEAKDKVVASYLADGRLCSVVRDQVTKVKLQMVCGTIPEEDLADVGNQIGTDVMAVWSASKSGIYTQDGGVRFPNNSCLFCEMNPICLRDSKRRDETLVQIGPKVQEDDWLKELEGDDSE